MVFTSLRWRSTLYRGDPKKGCVSNLLKADDGVQGPCRTSARESSVRKFRHRQGVVKSADGGLRFHGVWGERVRLISSSYCCRHAATGHFNLCD